MSASSAIRAGFLLIVLLHCSCIGYEDGLSGHYRQTIGEDRAARLQAIEVFRRGDSIQAILRRYESVANLGADADPFSEEVSCLRTEVGTLAEDDSFELFSTDGSTRVQGRFVAGGLDMRINAAENTPTLEMNLTEFEPNPDCEVIEPKTVTAEFSGPGGPNEFPKGVYEIMDPEFGVQWVSVEERLVGDLPVFSPATPELISGPIGSYVTDNRLGLEGAVQLPIAPPPRGFRTPSGSTEYSVAHFIVVDDDPDDDGEFSWDKDEEPIIAAGIRKGQRQIPEGWDDDFREQVANHNRFGRAILYVQGNLDELDPALLDTFADWDLADVDEHFWIVEVFGTGEEIIGLRFLPNTRGVPVSVTTDYLQDSQIRLPRLFPAN